MIRSHQRIFLTLFLFAAPISQTYGQDLAPGEKEPLLRLEAGGPTSYVTALAFNNDGKMLYSAGWDKVVRVWRLNGHGKFVLDRDLAYRVPLGPGLNGAINTIALSDDGNWLAVAGLGVARAGAGFRQAGLILPTLGGLGEQSRLDQGTVYLFNTKTQKAKLLRGHTGEVYSLSFAPTLRGESPKLVSLGKEWQTEAKEFDVSLRLWDIDKGSSVDTHGHLPTPPARPTLAVWCTTTDASLIQAGVNLGDGKIRVWKSDGKKSESAVQDEGALVINTMVLPGAKSLITAGYGAGKARLRDWKLTDRGAIESDNWSVSPAETANAFPRALGWLASHADGKADLAAAVVRMQDKAQNQPTFEYRLQVFHLGQESFGTVVADLLLWKSDLKQPVLATSPQGHHIAVAGNGKHEIQIYAIKDLVQGTGRPATLHSEGANLRYASFVTNKTNDLGLLLNEAVKESPGDVPREVGPGDFLFDFRKRKLSEETAGWKVAAPPQGDWKATLALRDKDGPLLKILSGDELIQQISLRPETIVTDFALLPPNSKVAKVPLVGVASHIRGQPTLALYNAQSGEQVRQYSGHADPIYSLAFSPDGRLLVSVAEDQTVNVWSLADLGKTLCRLGMIKGLAVQKTKGSKNVTIAAVSPTSPAADKIKANDAIDGIVKGDSVQSLTEVRQYYDQVSKLKPGSPITLRVLRDGQSVDVALPVSQGVDDQKPLFSLFLTRDGKAEDRHWIGWNPIGPYEASSPRAEDYLGWHFNTGQAEEPARFAHADQYHKTYYREGVLKQLIATGDPTQIPSPDPGAPPRMTLLIDDHGEYPLRDDKGQLLVRHGDVRLKVVIQNGSLDSIKSMTWKKDDGQENSIDLQSQDGNEVVIPLKLAHTLQTIRVNTLLAGVDSKTITDQVAARYQPSAPRLELSNANAVTVVKEGQFKLKGKLLAPREDQPATVRLIHRHDKEIVREEAKSYTLKSDEPQELEWAADLKSGVNHLEVVAAYKDALVGYEEFETTRKSIEVILEGALPAPIISIDKVEAIDSLNGSPIDFKPGLPILARASAIQIHGKVEAKANLAKAEWTLGDKDRPHSLTGFESDKTQSLEFIETISLKPGKQVVRFLAATAKSGSAESRLEVIFQPPLPTVEISSPAVDQRFYGDKETLSIDLIGNVNPSSYPEECQALLVVDGREQGEAVTIGKDAQVLKARAVLRPGSNRIQVRLTNAWGAEFLSDSIAASYLRPPSVLEVDAPRVAKQPLLSLTVKGKSPLPLVDAAVVLEINGKKHTVDSKNDLSLVDSKDGTFLISLRNVPMEADPDGKKRLNEVLVWLNNSEGRSLQPGKALISFEPDQPPPEVTFLEPRNNSMVYSRNVPIRFRVLSTTPLTSVSLSQEGKTLFEVDGKSAKKNEEGKFEITTEPTAKLQRGLNTLRLSGRNGGGQSTASLVLNFPYKPVRLQIDRLESKGPSQKSVECEVGEDCMIRFPKIDSGRVRLAGRVIWDDPEDDERLTKANLVRVFVNGFQQIPGVLQPVTKENRRVREFQADILLNEEKDNKVGISVPGLEQDAGNRTVFIVDCEKPVKEQRLHLLVLSFKQQDEKKLKDHFLNTLQVDQGRRDRLFSYGPLTGYYVRQEYINTQVSIIRTRIKELAATGNPCNDVIVFYYQGGESVKPQGVVFKTCDCNPTDDNPEPPNALTCKRLVNYFAETPGAHLVFLDVDKVDASKDLVDKNEVTGWDDNFPQVKMHVALMHYAWVGRAEEPIEAKLLAGLSKARPKKVTLIDMERELESFSKGLQRIYPDSIRFLTRKPIEMAKIVVSP
jgi:WD40 repeat protein